MANNFEAELEEPIEFSNLYRLEFVEGGADDEVVLFKLKQSSELPFLNGTFRRCSSFRSSIHRPISEEYYPNDLNCNSLVISDVNNRISDGMLFNPKERKNKIFCTFDYQEKVNHIKSSPSDSPPRFQLISDIVDNETKQNYEISSVTNPDSHHHYNNKLLDDSLPSYFLDFIAGLVIKAIGFQFSLFISFITFPLWFMYCSFMFVTNPLGFFKWIIKRTTQKLLNFGGGIVPFVLERITGEKSIRKLLIRLSWGIFWSFYVCLVLFGILVSGFVIGGIVMRYIVEEPLKTTEILNFDYTKSTPVALVPITGCVISASCNGADCNDEKFDIEKYVVGSSHVIPPHHKMKLTISLTMPESDYNRKLGIFQVRVDFLSADGKVTRSSRHPCMLRFKSQLLHYMETFIRSLPLVAGYSSESQILDLKMKSMNEENEPTSCLMVTLEQRAEYKAPGAGIPEIYDASMVLESELPLYKRIVWNWRKTIFVWTSMISFMMELIMILLFCRPIILPRTKPRLFAHAGSAANKIADGNKIALIKGS